MYMKIYYVTGVSAAGKSEVCKKLSARGYLAYEGDENGLTRWEEKKTGNFINSSDRVAGPNGSLVELYDWNMSRARIKELANEGDSKFMFICGTAANRYDLWDMFEKVFCLSIDEDTLVHRLATRTNNDFGKDPRDLKDVIGWHKYSEQTDIEAGAILIDATQSVDDIVDKIIENIDQAR